MAVVLLSPDRALDGYATVVEFEGYPLASRCPDRAWCRACRAAYPADTPR